MVCPASLLCRAHCFFMIESSVENPYHGHQFHIQGSPEQVAHEPCCREIEMIARSTTQVVAKPTTPRSATKRALDLAVPRNAAKLRFRATLSGRGFAGDPLCSSGITCFADEPTLALKRRLACEWNDHSLRLASRVSSRNAAVEPMRD